jgi:hypothetical protein
MLPSNRNSVWMQKQDCTAFLMGRLEIPVKKTSSPRLKNVQPAVVKGPLDTTMIMMVTNVPRRQKAIQAPENPAADIGIVPLLCHSALISQFSAN